MTVRNSIAVLLVFTAVSFAQSADSTVKTVAPATPVVSSVAAKSDATPQLKKTQMSQYVKPQSTSTWSKIKDLFM